MSIEELEALKKDAERYRFLKSKAKLNDYWGMFDIEVASRWVDVLGDEVVPMHVYSSSFDDAVDAEMRRDKNNG